MKKRLVLTLFASSCLAAVGGVAWTPYAHAAVDSAVPVVADGISGVVTGPKGPEAGVWVIAETKDLPNRFIKIVVTDDQGRYVVPELPKAKYKVWVRGYGLVDSNQVDAEPGKQVNLTAVVAPDAKTAAQYYPADYWYALIHPPAASEFPGTGATGNGIAPTMKTQQDWLATMKFGCVSCHQLGDQITREPGNNTAEGWGDRIQQTRPPGDPVIGNQGKGYAYFMQFTMASYGRQRALNMYADWTGRIAKGEYPTQAPPRPTGIERNLVVTEWDWGEGTYIHDEVATDRRNPTVNANGDLYGVASNTGQLVILNPKTHTSQNLDLPGAATAYAHSIMLDEKGRAWITNLGSTTFQPEVKVGPRPDYCTDGAKNQFARYFPIKGKANGFWVYDPSTKAVSSVPSCFRTQHHWFAHDKDNTLFFAGDNVVGWIDTKVWDETHDPQKSEGWCPMVIDTKEKGLTKVALGADEPGITPDHTQWNEMGKTSDPKKDTHISSETYGVGVNDVDGSIWLGISDVPGSLVRFDRGAHPPETCKSEYYLPPKLADGSYAAFVPHDVGFDAKGIAWVTFTSGQIGRFDRSKCKVFSGPTATGQQCPEGWTIYDDAKSPRISGTNLNADFYYQMFVDNYDTFGLGKDVPIVNGANSDSLKALMPDTGKYVTLRVPYPRGYFGRWTDGRIDNPATGWKGRAVWSNFSMVPVWHQEGGDDGGPELVKFQMRPDPLAH